MGNVWTDLTYSVRKLMRTPGFTVLAVLVLALGIGGTTGVFTLIDAMVLQAPPHIAEPEDLALVYGPEPPDYHPSPLSYPAYEDVRDGNEVFEDLAAYGLVGAHLGEGPESTFAIAQITTENFFQVLGAPAAMGRVYGSDGGETETDFVVVLSHRTWQEQFGGDPDIVGKTVAINNHPFTVWGVAPRGFSGAMVGLPTAVWVPMASQPLSAPGEDLTNRNSIWLSVVGRLKPGTSLEAAQANLMVLANQLEATYPDSHEDWRLEARAFSGIPHLFKADVFTILGLLFSIAALVLLIAGGNVGGMLLARGEARRQEAAVFMSMGAKRHQVVRQFILEVVVLFAAGGIGGVLLATWTGRLLRVFERRLELPIFVELTGVDASVLAFAFLVTLLTGIAFGLVPALRLPQKNLATAIREDAAHAPRRLRMRSVFVGAQIAGSLVVLVTAGLFLRALQEASRIDPGFEAEGAYLITYDPSLEGADESSGRGFYRELLTRVGALAGVRSATLAETVPLGPMQTREGISAEGVELPEGRSTLPVSSNVVAPEYFETLGIRILQGEDFSGVHRTDTLPVVIVNETLARRFWPESQSPVGQRLYLGEVGSGSAARVIGVARDAKYEFLDERPQPRIYLPFEQRYRPQMTLIFRGEGGTEALVQAVSQVAGGVNPTVPVVDAGPMVQHLGAQVARQRMGAAVSLSFGILAMLLTAAGIYGLVSYAAAQRTQEMGIRMALGADTRSLVWLVTRQGLVTAAVGLAAGLLSVFAVTRLLESFLLGVSPTDVLTLLGAAVFLAAVVGLASYLPARTASRLHPSTALHTG